MSAPRATANALLKFIWLFSFQMSLAIAEISVLTSPYSALYSHPKSQFGPQQRHACSAFAHKSNVLCIIIRYVHVYVYVYVYVYYFLALNVCIYATT